jgi:excinuclease ABC subunit A
LEVFEAPGLAPLSGPCPVCEGRRFNRETLRVRWKGHNAAELLELDVLGALSVFSHLPRLQIPLRSLIDVGLGYLRLGQPTDTLSGGEAQRLLLSKAIADVSGRKPQIEQLLVMDNPSAGLHEQDIASLVEALQELHRKGVSLLVADNHPSFAAAANHVLKLGPGAGPEGGRWCDPFARTGG